MRALAEAAQRMEMASCAEENFVEPGEYNGSKLSTPTHAHQPKRRKIFRTATVNNPELEEDDLEQLRNRQMQRIVEKARQLGSPRSPNTTNRSSLGKHNMSNAQIADHYSNCLKLSAENKINLKNAFNLQLIDYMSDMLYRRENADTNFQMAGTTIDASVKIYAYRVDNVHNEMFRVAGGLGRPEKKNDESVEDMEAVETKQDEVAEVPAQKQPKKRTKKTVKGNNIESNEAELNVAANECECVGDAIFDKIRAQYEEGVTYGLFLSTLNSAADSNRLMLHCLTDHKQKPAENSLSFELEELNRALTSVTANAIAPSLGDFRFDNWKVEDASETELAAEALPEEETKFVQNEFVCKLPSDFGLEEEAADDDGPMDDWESFHMPQATKAQMNGKLTLDEVAATLSSRPLEYSYFDANVVSTWAGPEHWKQKAKKTAKTVLEKLNKRRSDEDLDKLKNGRQKTTTRKRKQECKVDFHESKPVQLSNQDGGAKLPKATLEKWKLEDNLLDVELDYDNEDICRTFLKPCNRLTKSGVAGPSVVADNVGDYNLAGEFDKNNFCPSVHETAEQPGDDDDVRDMDYGEASFGDNDGAGKNTSADGCAANAGDTAIQPDRLLQQPYTINKIDVAYAQKAKKIDVRRLKKTMWSLLTKKTTQDSTDESAELPKSKSKHTSKSFNDLYREMRSQLPTNTAENVSVPIAVVCLLHLCNEKELSLEGNANFNDFHITME